MESRTLGKARTFLGHPRPFHSPSEAQAAYELSIAERHRAVSLVEDKLVVPLASGHRHRKLRALAAPLPGNCAVLVFHFAPCILHFTPTNLGLTLHEDCHDIQDKARRCLIV